MTDITQESLQKKQEAIDLLAKRTVRRKVNPMLGKIVQHQFDEDVGCGAEPWGV